MTCADDDDFSPICVGDTAAKLTPQFKKKVAGVDTPVSLAGATITMKMRSSDGFTVKVCAGPWSIVGSASDGVADYHYQSGDVDTAGDWDLYIVISIGGEPVHADTKRLTIKSAP
jgi:hypothetical protein